MSLLHRYIIYYYYAKLQDYSQYYDNNDNYIDYSNNYCYCYCCCYTIAKKKLLPLVLLPLRLLLLGLLLLLLLY